jgi:branched-chain amino acid transport system ATP-binding protein
VITGLYAPDAGRFELDGQPYSALAVHEVAQAGIARTFQNIRLFAGMTALENVMVGRHARTPQRRAAARCSSRVEREEEAAIRDARA